MLATPCCVTSALGDTATSSSCPPKQPAQATRLEISNSALVFIRNLQKTPQVVLLLHAEPRIGCRLPPALFGVRPWFGDACPPSSAEACGERSEQVPRG